MYALVKQSVTNTPGTVSGFTLGAAVAEFMAFPAAANGLSFDCMIEEAGLGKELRTGCVYTHSGTTLTRGTLEASTSGSALNFTSACKVSIVLGQAKASSLEQQLDRGRCHIQNDGVTTQSITAFTSAKIAAALTTVVSNPRTEWDTTNKKFLPTRAGLYLCEGSVQSGSGSSCNLQANLYKNGANDSPGCYLSNSSGFTQGNAASVIYLNGSTDYVELWVYQSITGNTNAAAIAVWFKATYLG